MIFCKEQLCLENTRASKRSSWTTNSLHHSLTVEALHRFAKTFRFVRTTHLYCVALLQTINFQTISSESIQWRCASELSTDSHHLLVLNSYRFLPASVLNINRFCQFPSVLPVVRSTQSLWVSTRHTFARAPVTWHTRNGLLRAMHKFSSLSQ